MKSDDAKNPKWVSGELRQVGRAGRVDRAPSECTARVGAQVVAKAWRPVRWRRVFLCSTGGVLGRLSGCAEGWHAAYGGTGRGSRAALLAWGPDGAIARSR